MLGRPFAQIQTLVVRPRLLPLLHHDVEIKSFQLSRPVVELVRNEQGAWNFSNLMQYKQQTHKKADLSLDRFKIIDGQVAWSINQRHPRTGFTRKARQPGQSGPPVPAPAPNSLKNLFDTFGKRSERGGFSPV